jgi:hypothetical protein
VARHEALRRPVEPGQHLEHDIAFHAATLTGPGHAGHADRVQDRRRIRTVDLACRAGPAQPEGPALGIERRVQRYHVEVCWPGLHRADQFLTGRPGAITAQRPD